jgi:hypothetical protein
MNDESATRPGLRLALTLWLGLLGAWLMPVRQSFRPGILGAQHGPALLAWLAVAFAGVLLLHRETQAPTPRRLLVFMGLAAALALARTPAPGMFDMADWRSIARISAIALLFLMAGGSLFGMAARPTSSTPWMVFLLRGPALAITSPLLLFASRPRAGTPGSTLVRTASLLFLCALASPMLTMGRDSYPQFLWSYVNIDNLGAMASSFVAWSWFGCAALALLTPWPKAPVPEAAPHRGLLNKRQLLGGLSFIGAAVVILAVLKWKTFLAALAYALLIVFTEWYLLALLLLLCPCLLFPRLPRLASPVPGVRLSTLGTLTFMALVLGPFASWCRPPIRCLFNGQLFSAHFDTSWVGWILDQSTIQCGLWRFTCLTAMAMAYVAVARWAGDRSTRRGYWAFTVPTLALFSCLLSYLTCVFYSLAVYIHTLGFTTLRVYGLLYGVCCYSATVRFIRWAVQKPDRKEGIERA